MTIDYCVFLDNESTGYQNADQLAVRYHRLIVEDKKIEADTLRANWAGVARRVSISEPTGEIWRAISEPKVEIGLLPSYSFWLRLTFTLAQPYISRGDNLFYIIDNPIPRDKIYRLPVIRATHWKGILCSALWQLGYDKKDDLQIKRLFGEASDDHCRSGRLYFYPTFFTTTGLEIINPHDRKRRVGKNPILFESVPRNTCGTFTILYVPTDLIEKSGNLAREIASDLQLLIAALRFMFCDYGFSAKRSSGYGLAEEKIEDGALQVHLGGAQRFECGFSSFTEFDEIAKEAAKALLQSGGGK